MGQKASISEGGKMSQKSIASFFGKPASKKVVEGEKGGEGVENGAKTKKDTAASGNANDGAKKIQDDVKQTRVEEEAGKENSKNGANTGGVAAAAATNGGPLPLDAEGLPPLRKTAVNPAFKRKSSSEDAGSLKKLPKTEDSGQKENLKGKENDQKKNTKPEKEVKHKPEKEVKHKPDKPEKAAVEDNEEPMEVESPVKSSKKKKKCVIDSDSEEEAPKNTKKKKAITSDSEEESPVKKKALVKS